MRRKLLFASQVALGLSLALISSLAILLVSIAPNRVEGGIAWVYLHHPDQSLVKISGHDLTCERQPDVDQCTIELQERLLQMSVIYKDGSKRQMWDYENVECQATYGDRSVDCSVNYDYATGAIPIVDISDSLSLNGIQFRALQHRSNPLFRLYDGDWIKLTTGLGIGVAFLVGFSIVLHQPPNAVLVRLSNTVGSGAVMFVLVSLLLANFGQQFNLPLVAGVSIATSIGTSMFLWFRRDRLAQLVTSISSGFIVFGILWYGFLLSLLTLGFVD